MNRPQHVPRSGRPAGLRSGMIYVMALVVVTAIAGITMVMARGTAVTAEATRFHVEQVACRLAAEGLLRAMVADIDRRLEAGRGPGLDQVPTTGLVIGEVTVLVLGRDPDRRHQTFGLIHEAGLVDLNHAPLAVLMAIPGLDRALAEAIISYRGGPPTTDTQRTVIGRSGQPFEHLEELRLLSEVTDDLFFGEDRNRNGLLDPGEDLNGNGLLDPGLRDLCTLESREPALAPDGRARRPVMMINRTMRSLLVDTLGEERGNAAYTLALAGQPFATRFGFLAALDLDDLEIAALWPFLNGEEGRLGLIDAWSCDNGLLHNLVGPEMAARIIAARPSRPPQDPAWLLAALTGDEIERAGFILTSGSHRLRADILAIHHGGRGWARLDATLDCSGGRVRVLRLQWADQDGWPLVGSTPGRPAGLDPASALWSRQ